MSSVEEKVGELKGRADAHDTVLAEIKTGLKTILTEQRKLPQQIVKISRKIARAEISKSQQPTQPPLPPQQSQPNQLHQQTQTTQASAPPLDLTMLQKIFIGIGSLGMLLGGAFYGFSGASQEGPKQLQAPVSQQQGVRP